MKRFSKEFLGSFDLEKNMACDLLTSVLVW